MLTLDSIFAGDFFDDLKVYLGVFVRNVCTDIYYAI